MSTIMVGDGHEIVRRGLRNLISTNPNWHSCGEASDGISALALALKVRPTIAILDISLPSLSGLFVTRRLQSEAPETSVLLFTAHSDPATVRAGIAAGARGYVLKSDSVDALEAAISALAAGEPYVTTAVSHMLAATQQPPPSPVEKLTNRQLQVTQLIAEGYSNKQVARILSLSIKTSESHRLFAMRKVGAHTTAELVRFAIRNKLIQP